MDHKLILALGALLSSWLPAAAQTLSSPSREESSWAIVALFRAVPTPLPQSTVVLVWPPAKPPAHFTPARSLQRLFPVEVLRSPFVKQWRVTVVRLSGGRLQLGGVVSSSRRENSLLGFPDSADLVVHPSERLQQPYRSYGLSLTYHFGSDAHANRRGE